MSTEETPTTGRVRASDAEREQFAALVRDALADGRLTMDEGDERLAAIYATKFRDELRPIVSDLPAAASLDQSGQRGPGRRGEWQRGEAWPRGEHGPRGDQQRGEWQRGMAAWNGAPARVHPAAFAFHFVVVAAMSLGLIGIWALTGSHFFWPAIPLVFFALGLVRHARWGARRRWYRGAAR